MGLSLDVPKGVAAPLYSTFAFIHLLKENQRWWRHARTVIDVGCGCGVLGIWLGQRLTAKVYLLDQNPLSCRAAQVNADANGVNASTICIDIRLRTSIPPLSADLIVANLPLQCCRSLKVEGSPLSLFDKDYHISHKFFSNSVYLLGPTGRIAYCASETLGDIYKIERMIRASPFKVEDLSKIWLHAPTAKHPEKVHNYSLYILSYQRSKL